MAIPSSAQELRQFLDQCLNATSPMTYTDRAGHDHRVFLTKVEEAGASLRRDEAVLALTMIETVPEAQEGGATGARQQELFLLQCVDSTTPIEYTDRQSRKHRVFMTRMTLNKRVAKKRPAEWLYALTMVDAWGGVWICEFASLKIRVTTTITLRTHVTDVIGSENSIGSAQIGV